MVIMVHTSVGFRLSLTRPSMMAGMLASIMAWHSSLAKSTICCSVVSLVMKLSRSVITSMQMEQVSSFLGAAKAEATRAESRKRAAFMVVVEVEVEVVEVEVD